MKSTVTLVDAMAWIFRYYYGQEEMSNPQGVHTHATFGFLHFLLRQMDQGEISHMAVVFDAEEKTFRSDIYPEYKANRGEPPEDLIPQFGQCELIVKALGLPLFKQAGYEADDLIASLTKICRSAEHHVRILTGDKDLTQLVSHGTTLYDPARRRSFTPNKVHERFGVNPEQMRDWLALCGDASDNIPGVPGVGPKTATGLLNGLDSLDGIYDNLEAVAELPLRGAKKLGAKLETYREVAYLAQQLVTLKDDVELDVRMEDLEYKGADKDACETLFEELGFEDSFDLIPRFSA
jgi:DNA polymerase-1